jgi:cell division protein FtsW (lipid II flippase)
MKELKGENNNDDYVVDFKGAKLNKREANRVGLSIIFGFIGILITFFLPYELNSKVNYLTILMFIFIGYFVVAPKVFKKKRGRLG